MAKYMEPVLKVIILLTLGMLLMRIYYLWSIRKESPKDMFRNRDGDFFILILFLFVMNKSRFERYKLSYQPLLRHLYIIIVGLFIAYCIHQLTQIIVLAKKTFISPQGVIKNKDINKCKIKQRIYGYKVTISYMKKEKETRLTLIIGEKNKQALEKRFKKQNINIV